MLVSSPMSETAADPDTSLDREQRILDAALALLSQHGISGVSMRAVARQAGVSLGLVHYYYRDKVALMAAALRRVEDSDLLIVRADPGKGPEDNLRKALRRVVDPKFLTTDYLSLRLQLWALAPAHPEYEEINTSAQSRYRKGLSALIRAARPDLSSAAARQRAEDIDIIQNGIWVTSLLGVGRPAVRRCVTRCEEIAFAD